MLDIEDELDSQTVNGWAMEELEKIPEVGDSFEFCGIKVEVLEMDGRRIENIKVTDLRKSDEEDDDSDDEHEQQEIKF